ncbi:hypothetical protein [Mycobacteroides franklinii]|uniref:hypothetical protein n=1 Tax=Mycobacteroides franklinii TaxID=948102 RepID=UPI0013E8B971|nr:hypothetical protein [Mycobacteroides franklinii]
MKRLTTIVALLALAAATACGGPDTRATKTTSEDTMQPTTLTVTEAARITAGYVSLVSGQDVDPGPDSVEKVGCLTNKESLMSEGPPWKVRRQWWVDNPPAELVDGAMGRLDSLAAQGFKRQPWTRPDPEPSNTKTYQDPRGYVVGARAYTTAGGRDLFEVTAMSPCAGEG